jgi:hypothetical protein
MSAVEEIGLPGGSREVYQGLLSEYGLAEEKTENLEKGGSLLFGLDRS